MIADLSLMTFPFPGALESSGFFLFGLEDARVYRFELWSSIENAPLVLIICWSFVLIQKPCVVQNIITTSGSVLVLLLSAELRVLVHWLWSLACMRTYEWGLYKEISGKETSGDCQCIPLAQASGIGGGTPLNHIGVQQNTEIVYFALTPEWRRVSGGL